MLSDSTIRGVAKAAGIEPAILKAVVSVESRGKGFLPSHRPVILFEGHVFWRRLMEYGVTPEEHVAGNENILYPKWTKRFYVGGEGEWDRLDKAKNIHEEAALESASWGLFQIMGFNYKLCGYNSVNGFVFDMRHSEHLQVEAFIKFIQGRKLDALRSKDWKTFSRLYNGPKYYVNKYDERLENFYNKYQYLNEDQR